MIPYLKENLGVFARQSIESAKKLFFKPVIEDYYRRDHKKRALISYITGPFRKGNDYSHTNFKESIIITETLDTSGFVVDVVDYNYEGFINFNKYDLIIGFGNPFVNSFSARKKIIRVLYATGMHIVTQNGNSVRRIKEVYNKKGVYLPGSGRIVENAWWIQSVLCDAIISLGDETAAESYRKFYDGDVFALPPSYYRIHDAASFIEMKNFSKARNHFLWFGSSGFIHKGVDLLLDFFSQNRKMHLHICGPITNEEGFSSAYGAELALDNIHVHGFVNINSGKFEELLKKCAFVIYPSCSEGGSPSVLNVTGNGGLIPLVSREATMNAAIPELIFESLDINAIGKIVSKVTAFPDEDLRKLSHRSAELTTRLHSEESYRRSLKEIFETIFNKNEL